MSSEYPRTQITVIVQLCSTDGSIGAVAGNAAFLALLDAGIAMRATVLSVSVGVRFGTATLEMEPPRKKHRPESETERPPDDALLLDPTEAEEQDCDAVVTIGVDGRRAVLVSSLCSGSPMDAVAWAGCAQAGSKAC